MSLQTPTARSIVASAFLVVSFVVSSCATAQTVDVPDYVIAEFGALPPVQNKALSSEAKDAIQIAFIDIFERATWGPEQDTALQVIKDTSDPRLAWIVSDLLRFVTSRELNDTLAGVAAHLLQVAPEKANEWGTVTDHLIAWDIPAPPDYLDTKRKIFTSIAPGWDRIFTNGDIDWRHVSWGGVLIDDRDYDTTDTPCNCIPAADNPKVVAAQDATWPTDNDIVFGVEVNGEYRAYPRQIMEVREMVNDTLGGRDLGIPYCTLCGAAQAYFTDNLTSGVERPILRTSGLLIRSNKVMYDINTYSVFDTFKGNAVTGPLAKKNIQLEQAAVITTTWGDWKKAHPETTVLTEDLALGRNPDFRNTRDANGPIFPVGDVDPRLPVHEDIVGAIAPDGTPVAFQRSAAMAALLQDQTVSVFGVQLKLDAGGIMVTDPAGNALGSHQAFWFAWAQFHPNTQLWQG